MGATRASVLARPRTEREQWSEELLDRLTPVMAPLGVIFVLVVLGQQLTRPGSGLAITMAAVGWLLWAVFVAEFLARLVVAPSTGAFLRKNWWQAVFLLLPFLRVLRLVRSLRVLRSGQLLSSTVRGSRSARQVLSSRLGWLGSVVAMVVLGTSQLLYTFSGVTPYAQALHAAALGAVTGEPLPADDGFAQIVEVLLAVFSVVVFGTFAALVGAFFVRNDTQGEG